MAEMVVYLENYVSRNLIYDGMLLFELQCRLQFVPQLDNISFNLPYLRLV